MMKLPSVDTLIYASITLEQFDDGSVKSSILYTGTKVDF